jgi:O-antigen ligase
LLGIPLAWHLFKLAGQNKNRLLRIINITYIPLAIFSILLTASRTSLFAIVPAMIFIFWPKKLNLGRILLVMLVIIILLFFFQALLPTEIVERLASTSSSISSSDIGGRVSLWKAAISIFLDHFFLGIGSGTSPIIIGSVAHQIFLSILAETGIIGFILFMSILGIVINQAIKLPKGYSGLWLSVVFVWLIGVLSLSWEVAKATWLFLSFVIIEGAALVEINQNKNEEAIMSGNLESEAFSTTEEQNGLLI